MAEAWMRAEVVCHSVTLLAMDIYIKSLRLVGIRLHERLAVVYMIIYSLWKSGWIFFIFLEKTGARLLRGWFRLRLGSAYSFTSYVRLRVGPLQFRSLSWECRDRIGGLVEVFYNNLSCPAGFECLQSNSLERLHSIETIERRQPCRPFSPQNTIRSPLRISWVGRSMIYLMIGMSL